MTTVEEKLFDASGLCRVLTGHDEALGRINERSEVLGKKVDGAMDEMAAWKAELVGRIDERSEILGKKVDEATEAFRVLRRQFVTHRAVVRLGEFAKHRTEIMLQLGFDQWRRGVRCSRDRDDQRKRMDRLLRRMGRQLEASAMETWKDKTARGRLDARRCEGIAVMADAVLRKWRLRRAFRRWWDENTGAALLGANLLAEDGITFLNEKALVQALTSTKRRRSSLFEIIDKATGPYARRAAELAKAGDVHHAMREFQRSSFVTAKILATQSEVSRVQDFKDMESKLQEVRQEIDRAQKTAVEKVSQEATTLADQTTTKCLESVEEKRLEDRVAYEAMVSEVVAKLRDAQEAQRVADATVALESRSTREAQLQDKHRSALRQHGALVEEKCRQQALHDVDLALAPLRDQIQDGVWTTTALAERFAKAEERMAIERRETLRECAEATEALSVSTRASLTSLATAQMHHEILAQRQLDAAQKALTERLDDIDKRLLDDAMGAAPPRPSPRLVALRIFGPYEDAAWEARRVPALGQARSLLAAKAARAVADHAAVSANLEEVARVAADFPQDQPDVLGPGFGADEIAAKRHSIVMTFLGDVEMACHDLRPSAGALRCEARHRLLRRFERAIFAALSVYDQVICDAPTLLGRKAALPSCVACNRPLPTKALITEKPLGERQKLGLLASTGPPIPRPQSAPQWGSGPGNKKKALPVTKDLSSSSHRASTILHSMAPLQEPFGDAALLKAAAVDDPHPVSEDQPPSRRPKSPQQPEGIIEKIPTESALLLQEALQQRDLLKVEAVLMDTLDTTTTKVKMPTPTPGSRGFRASKRLPPGPNPLPTGRALP